MQWRCVLFRQKIVILTEDDPGIPKNSLAKSDTNILFLIVIVARYYCTRSLLQEILKGTKIYCAPNLQVPNMFKYDIQKQSPRGVL